MKELDIALTGYLDKFYESADSAEQATFRALLDLQDRELFELIIGNATASDPDSAAVIAKIRRSITP